MKSLIVLLFLPLAVLADPYTPSLQPTPADGLQSCGMLVHDDLNTILGLRTNLLAAGRKIEEQIKEIEGLKAKDKEKK